MGRPQLISDEALLDAARQVFLEKGLHASTEDVAARAGCSQGVVFKRFRSKADLFHAAMNLEQEVQVVLETADGLEARAGQGDFEANLLALGQLLLGQFRRMIPLIMMRWASAGEVGAPHVLMGKEPAPVRVMGRFARYFGAEMKARHLDGPDPMIVTRTFLGAIWHFVMLEVTIPGRLPLTAEEFLPGLTQLCLHGLKPRPARGRSHPRRSAKAPRPKRGAKP